MNEFFQKMIDKMKRELFTIPNMLSIFRFLLIPVIVYLYCFKQDDMWTLIIILLSSLTDVIDGFIARTFNMITDLGKLLDPVADKATQIVVIACLITRFPWMMMPFAVLIVKELGSLALRFVVYKRTEVVEGAHWHGKAATCFVIAMVLSHIIWGNMDPMISFCIIGFTTVFLLFSGTLYTIEAFQIMKNGKKG